MVGLLGTECTDRLNFSTYVGSAVMGTYSSVVETRLVWLVVLVFFTKTRPHRWVYAGDGLMRA